jgi:hypothetical protein
MPSIYSASMEELLALFRNKVINLDELRDSLKLPPLRSDSDLDVAMKEAELAGAGIGYVDLKNAPGCSVNPTPQVFNEPKEFEAWMDCCAEAWKSSPMGANITAKTVKR